MNSVKTIDHACELLDDTDPLSVARAQVFATLAVAICLDDVTRALDNIAASVSMIG